MVLETELLGDYSSLERVGVLTPLNDYHISSWVDGAKGKKCRNFKLKSDQRLVYAKLNNNNKKSRSDCLCFTVCRFLLRKVVV